MSIASSSGATNAMISSKSSFRGSRNGSTRSARSKASLPPVPPPMRPRKKRASSNSLGSDSSDVIRSISSKKNLHPDFDTSSDEKSKNVMRDNKKKPPPLPSNPPNLSE